MSAKTKERTMIDREEEALIAAVEMDMAKNQIVANVKVWIMMACLVISLYFIAKGIPMISEAVYTARGIVQ